MCELWVATQTPLLLSARVGGREQREAGGGIPGSSEQCANHKANLGVLYPLVRFILYRINMAVKWRWSAVPARVANAVHRLCGVRGCRRTPKRNAATAGRGEGGGGGLLRRTILVLYLFASLQKAKRGFFVREKEKD